MNDKKKLSQKQINEELAKEVAELTEALQRERADVINVRRRHEEQMAGLKTMLTANVVKQLLPTIDNLGRALKHVPKDIENHEYVRGVSGVVKQFEKTLSDIGVKKINTIGEHFDPSLHEAISMEDNGGDNEIIVEELQSGYTLDNQIIRHALVRVERK